jgi:hypothetical protein
VVGSAWSYYLSSSIPNIPYYSNVNSALTCAKNTASIGSQIAEFDTSSQTCYSQQASSGLLQSLIWDADTNVMVLGTCQTNDLIIPAAKGRCYDVTLTATSCTLANKAQCSTLLVSCTGSQFQNYDGICQDCSSAYQDATTCDINGANSCIDGDFLLAGTCSSCDQFDVNSASCDSTGTLFSCNTGWVLQDNACVVDNSAGPVVLDNSWSYYVDSFVTGQTAINTNSIDMFDCVEGAYDQTLTFATFDVPSNTCYAVNETSGIEAAIESLIGNAVFLLDTCEANSAQVGDAATSNCYDVIIDSDSCTNEDGSACS